jgi:HSP20 family protein
MTLHRYEPWYLVNRLHNDLDRLLSPAPSDDGSQGLANWAPHVDIQEEDNRFVLHADLPGVDPKDIDVTLEKGVLTLRGKRALQTRDEKNGFRRVERVSGEFFRSFTLPDTADSQSVRARHANGVLEVTIPKQAHVMPRRIDIEAA